MNLISAFVLGTVTFFASCALAEPPAVTPFRARAEDIVQGHRRYRVFFCLARSSGSAPTIQRPDARGGMIDFNVRGDSQNCYNFDESLSAEEGWREVCYRLNVDNQPRLIRMYFNPMDDKFTTALDSREIGEAVIVEMIRPKLNKNQENQYESAFCLNLSS